MIVRLLGRTINGIVEENYYQNGNQEAEKVGPDGWIFITVALVLTWTEGRGKRGVIVCAIILRVGGIDPSVPGTGMDTILHGRQGRS